MSKTVIIYASFGEGHKKAALALAAALGASSYDLLDFSHPLIKKIYTLSYAFITQRFTHLWKLLFSYAKSRRFSSGVNKIHQRIFASFFKFLQENKPDIIIVTHFFPSNLIAISKEKTKAKLISVVTDLRVHPVWFNHRVDYYFVALNETKEDLLKLGASLEQVFVGFVPLREGFLKDYSIESLYKRFYLRLKPSIIFVSSSRGNFPYFKSSIKGLLKDFNVFVIYGKNKRLKAHLEALDSPHIRFFPFHDEIWELISASSVIITKPGGLTIFEGLYKKKPFVFTHYIPGQERENMDLLVKHGLARFTKNKDEIIKAIYYFAKKSNELKNNYPIEIKNIRESLINLIKKLQNA